jgi:hypothetical protein
MDLEGSKEASRGGVQLKVASGKYLGGTEKEPQRVFYVVWFHWL